MGIKDAYDVIKDLVQLAQKAKNQEMITLALEAQIKLFELKEENQNLKNENSELKDNKALEADVILHKGGYVTRKSDNNDDLKYCGICWGKLRKLIPIVVDSYGCMFCADKKDCGSQLYDYSEDQE